MPRTIGFFASIALLVSNIIGPSLVVIPRLFQQAGWFTPVLVFATVALLTGAAASLLVEAMSSIEGNADFQACVEYTTLAGLFLGKRSHIVLQALLFLAMQSLVMVSLLEAFQSMDAFLVNVAHKTCAVSFTEGWVCVKQISQGSANAFSGYILCSFGTLITLSLVLPLSLFRLVDNISFQVASFILLLTITVAWIVIFAVKGLHVSPVPAVGHDHSNVAGFVLSNFSFVMLVPAWVNDTHPSVNIRVAVWTSVVTSFLIYISVGWIGGLAILYANSETLLQVLGTSTGHGALDTVAHVSTYVFPLAGLITSIPVCAIVIRYNLVRGRMCSKNMAIFWSAILPWLVVVPLQTSNALETMVNWTSLLFMSPINLLFPLVLFIASRRYGPSPPVGEMALGDLEMSVAPVERETTTTAHPTAEPRFAADATTVGCEHVDKAEAGEAAPRFALDICDTDDRPSIALVASSLNGARPDRRSGRYPAFPILSASPSLRSTHISLLGCLLSSVLILVGIGYSISRSVTPDMR